jgi:hypothetical protein
MSRALKLVVPALLVLLGLPAFAVPADAAPADVPSPEEFLGHPVGADRKLADYHQIVDYLDQIDAASDRLDLLRLGKTTLGEEFVVAVISSAENLANAGRYREMARKLADPRGLGEKERAELVATGKVIVLVTLSIHSIEIGASQMALELAWNLAMQENPDEQRWLEDVILLMVPALNPDGQLMVTDWYRKYVGTEFEGGPMPRLYHHYAGHDNNRDWFMLNLDETRLLSRLLYHDWHPHIFVDEHQMRMTSPRLFLPPFKDPPGEQIHPLIYRLIDRIGTGMALREQEAGHSGVIQSAIFDAYWLGGTRNTGWYKNVVGLLTEMASVRIASPVYVDPGELASGFKGLAEYGPQANYPDPWPGGWWHLRDIIDYELVLTRSLLETASLFREDFLRDNMQMALDAVSVGANQAPFGWAVPSGQRDPVATARMLELLRLHGVEVHRVPERFVHGARLFPAGSWVVRADQPYRAFAREVLQPQRYPEVKVSPDGPVLLPYDVNNWSLPALFGVETVPLDTPLAMDMEPVETVPFPEGGIDGQGAVALLAPAGNAPSVAVNGLLEGGAQVHLARTGFQAGGKSWPAGTALIRGDVAPDELARIAGEAHVRLQRVPAFPQVETLHLRKPRVGLYQGFRPSMDEGWTRLVLDRHGFDYVSLDPEAVKKGDLRDSLDVVILADESAAEIVEGKSERSRRRYTVPYPPDYGGGIGEEGVAALKSFVEAGGTLIALDSSAQIPVERWNLPVRRPLAQSKEDEFYCPGSMLKVDIVPQHPLGYGMPPRWSVLFAGSQPFQTQIPGAEVSRRVVARFPDEPLLVSGWIRGEELLHRKAALVEVGLGEGRVVLFGFRPQFRGQSEATFKMLFNAIFLGASEPYPLQR